MRATPVRVWVADLDDPATRDLEHAAFLDPDEVARAGAFRQPADRTRFVVGAALAKHAVAHEIGATAASIRIDRRCQSCGRQHGRPRAVGVAGVHISVAHSAALVAVALTRMAPVGIDVEHRSGGRDLPAEEIVSPSEPATCVDLLTVWCRKEAVLKATADGLRVPLTDVVLGPHQAGALLVSYAGRALAARITDVALGDGYAAAVAVLGDVPTSIEVRPAAALVSPGSVTGDRDR